MGILYFAILLRAHAGASGSGDYKVTHVPETMNDWWNLEYNDPLTGSGSISVFGGAILFGDLSMGYQGGGQTVSVTGASFFTMTALFIGADGGTISVASGSLLNTFNSGINGGIIAVQDAVVNAGNAVMSAGTVNAESGGTFGTADFYMHGGQINVNVGTVSGTLAVLHSDTAGTVPKIVINGGGSFEFNSANIERRGEIDVNDGTLIANDLGIGGVITNVLPVVRLSGEDAHLSVGDINVGNPENIDNAAPQKGELLMEDGASGTANSVTVGYGVAPLGGSVYLAGQGHLHVGGPAPLGDRNLNVSGDFEVGNGAHGEVLFDGGAAVYCNNATIGRQIGPDGASTMTVTGAGTYWEIGDTLKVGDGAIATLTISAGGNVVDQVGLIGGNSNLQNKVIVTGTDSFWSSSEYVGVGDNGHGELEVLAGAHVESTHGFVGLTSTGNGKVTIDGDGSMWTIAQDMTVGYNGTGTMFVQNKGKVQSGLVAIGSFGGSNGSVTVTGADASWTATDFFNVGGGGYGELKVLSGGAVSSPTGYVGSEAGSTGEVTINGTDSKWTMTGDLTVGDFGNGTLAIQNGGQVSDAAGKIGRNSGATGAVTVTGANSKWINDFTVSVGYTGTGTLSVTEGGTVSDAVGFIGLDPGSNGTATVDASSWTNSNQLIVGSSGTGTLNINNGATVSSGTGFIGEQTGSNGTVTIDASTWTNSVGLTVGKAGTGTLTIQNGGTISGLSGDIGFAAGSSGSVTVKQLGSSWSVGDQLSVGVSGTGTLEIRNAASVMSDAGYIGRNAGSTGTATVEATNAAWNVTNNLYIGAAGTGTLNITLGATVSSIQGFLGQQAGSTGTATLSGSNSTWTNSGNLTIGDAGTGTLNVNSGAVVSSQNGFVGLESGSNGTVKIDNGKWTITNALTAGTDGKAAVNLTNSGQLESVGGTIAVNSSDAQLALDHSTWTNTGTVTVARNDGSTGKLGIRNGSTVTNLAATLGEQTGSRGEVTVGESSQWTLSGDLIVGSAGRGELTAQVAGKITAPNLIFGNLAGSTFVGTATDLNTKVTVAGAITIGNHGGGNFFVTDNATVSADSTVVGNAADANASLTLNKLAQWTTNTLQVARSGTGSLNLVDGSLNSTSATLGVFAGSTATVNLLAGSVTGEPLWTNTGEAIIGNDGSATLNVHAGTFHTGALLIGAGNGSNGALDIEETSSPAKVIVDGQTNIANFGTATVTMADGTLTTKGGVILAEQAGSVANVELTNNALWDNFPNDLTVAVSGKASIVTGSGATIQTLNLSTAVNAGSDATIALNDAGTKLQTFGDVVFGGEGTSLVQVNDGAVLDTSGARIGNSLLGGTGRTSTVQIIGGQWQNLSSALVLGGLGNNLLQLTGGGRVDTQSLTLGQASLNLIGAVHDLVHADDSSTVNVTGLLTVGVNVPSKIEIYGNSRMFSATANIGNGAQDVSGVVEIAASGRWDNTGSIHIASTNTTSALQITDGGVVVTNGVDIGSAGSSTQFAQVTISHNGSALSATGAALNVGQFGNGILTINDHGLLLANDVNVYSMGIVNGNGGAIVANFHNLGGQISPGNSPGILQITGNYDQSAGALNIQIAGLNPGEFDVLDVSGSAILSGGALHFLFMNGFLPHTGDTIDFLLAGSAPQIDLDNVTLDYTGADPGFQFNVSIVGNKLEFTALNDAVPEPETIVLLASTAVAFLLTRRRLR